jgi:hypothetical protein
MSTIRRRPLSRKESNVEANAPERILEKHIGRVVSYFHISGFELPLL